MKESDYREARNMLAVWMWTARTIRSISVPFWAYKLKVSRGTVKRWERARAIPQIEQLELLADVFGMRFYHQDELDELRALINRSNRLELSEDRAAADRAIAEYRRMMSGFGPEPLVITKDVPLEIKVEAKRYDEPPAPASIFVSYRRNPSASLAALVVRCLRAKFGDGDVFFDVVSIRPAKDFTQEIRKALDACNVFVAIVGRDWEGSRENARPRIFDEDDYVAIEVRLALFRAQTEEDLAIIPVLVDNRSMPRVKDLSESLQSLAKKQALLFRDEHQEADCAELIRVIRDVIPDDDDDFPFYNFPFW